MPSTHPFYSSSRYLRNRVAALEATERQLRADLRRTRGGVSWDVPLESNVTLPAEGDADADTTPTAAGPAAADSTMQVKEELIASLRAAVS